MLSRRKLISSFPLLASFFYPPSDQKEEQEEKRIISQIYETKSGKITYETSQEDEINLSFFCKVTDLIAPNAKKLVSDAPTLINVNAPNLTEINISNAKNLKSIDLSNAEKVSLFGCPSIKEVNAPKVKALNLILKNLEDSYSPVVDYLFLSSNDKIRKIVGNGNTIKTAKFTDCDALELVDLKVEELLSFTHCLKLKEIGINETNSLQLHACDELKDVYFNGKNLYVHSCNKVKHVSAPYAVLDIAYCKNLNSVYFGNYDKCRDNVTSELFLKSIYYTLSKNYKHETSWGNAIRGRVKDLAGVNIPSDSYRLPTKAQGLAHLQEICWEIIKYAQPINEKYAYSTTLQLRNDIFKVMCDPKYFIQPDLDDYDIHEDFWSTVDKYSTVRMRTTPSYTSINIPLVNRPFPEL